MLQLNGKFYESEERKIISEFFPSGGIFVDVGANVGNHTVFVARFLSPLKVIVIEPNPAPHSARHAMGVHLVKKTGNPRTAQRQLGHKNPSTTMQYMQFTGEEMQDALDDR